MVYVQAGVCPYNRLAAIMRILGAGDDIKGGACGEVEE
jgi:hypothetical protein